MDLFTISQLSRFSGIKPHTIRIWEKRYNALKPTRSGGNTRYYDGEQLRRLLNIVSLMKSDHKVSELSVMPDEKLNKLVSSYYLKGEVNDPEEYFISQLINAGLGYNETYFEKIFAHSILRYGLKDAYIKVLYPMVNRIGLMWSDNSIPPAQEHFLSNLLRQKLLTAIDALPPATITADPWILFLPEDEYHEIGLLFAHYLVRSTGRRSVYLGANMPLESVRSAINTIMPGHMLFFLVHYDDPEQTGQYLRDLGSLFRKKIYMAGHPGLIGRLEVAPHMVWLKNVEDLVNVLENNVQINK